MDSCCNLAHLQWQKSNSVLFGYLYLFFNIEIVIRRFHIDCFLFKITRFLKFVSLNVNKIKFFKNLSFSFSFTISFKCLQSFVLIYFIFNWILRVNCYSRFHQMNGRFVHVRCYFLSSNNIFKTLKKFIKYLHCSWECHFYKNWILLLKIFIWYLLNIWYILNACWIFGF